MKKYLKAIAELYTLNKTVFKKNVLLFFGVLIILLVFDYRVLDVDLLNGYDVDEFYFLRILYSRQYSGFNHLDPQRFFSGFYSYGRLFWILNFLVTYLPFAFKKYNAALFITRLMSSLFATQGLLIFKETLRRFGYDKLPVILICGICLLMIGFWTVGSWIHPDWMMMFFVLLAFYYYFDVQNNPDRAPINFLIAFAIAIAIKVQTIQLMPLLLLYYFKDFLLRPSLPAFTSGVKKTFTAGVIILVIFILLNPYLIHPQGAKLFLESFTKDMESNKTNYWSGHIPTIGEKVTSYSSAYLSVWVMIITAVASIMFIFKSMWHLRASFEKLAFIIALVVMIAYYSFKVNKIWPHYYLPIALMALIVLYFSLEAVVSNPRIRNAVLGLSLVLQSINLYLHTSYLKDCLLPQRTLTAKNMYVLNNSITSFLKQHPDSKDSHISFTFLLPIPVNAAGLDFDKVTHIPMVNDDQLKQAGKLAPYPPDYLVVQKSMYYNAMYKSINAQSDRPVALLDSIKRGQLDNFKLVDSTQYLLFIKRVK